MDRIRSAPLTLLALPFCAQAACAQQSDVAAKSPPLDAWLQATYGEQAQWNGEWTLPGKDEDGTAITVKRRICVDSGPQDDGLRYLATCGKVEPFGHVTSGLVDLWIVQGAAGKTTTVASRRDIASGSMGGTGEVRLLRLGPDRVGFGVHSGFYNMGYGSDDTAVYVRTDSTIDEAFSYRSGSTSNGSSAMGRGECKTDADCERRFGWDITCTLEVDRKGAVRDGYFPLTVHARGTRLGRPSTTDIAVPMQGGKPAPDAAQLAKAGCGDADE